MELKIILLKFLGIYDKSIWYQENKNSFKNNLLFKNYIFPINKKVLLKTSLKIRKGWYLFGIKYNGDSKFVIGDIKLNNSYFNQGRAMNSGKFRWRTIRVNKSNNLQLQLNNILEKISINNIWLIKLPEFEAWRRIFKKIHEVKSSYFRPKKKIFSWMEYNRIFNKNIRDNYERSYKYWIANTEKNFLSKLIQNNYPRNNFKIFNKNYIYKMNNNEWAIIILEKGVLSLWAYDAINYALSTNKQCKILYTDEDCISSAGLRFNPYFKTAWNKELFISDPYYSGIWIISGSLLNNFLESDKKININLKELIYKILLTLDLEYQKKIYHLPIITFHRKLERKKLIRPSTSKNINNLIKKTLSKNSNKEDKIVAVKTLPKKKGYKVIWELPKNSFLSIIIPTKNNYKLLNSCIKSIFEYDPNINFEIIIVNNNSNEEATLKYLECIKEIKLIKIISIPGKFNFSRLNNEASKIAKGNVLLLLNNDVAFLRPDWGRELASYALRGGIGCVGAQLIYGDCKTIQHGGVILGIGGVAGHSHKYFDKNNMGYQNRLIYNQELSAVTGACLAISKRNWDKLNGLDEHNLKINYNDVDICLRANAIGLRNVYLPNVLAIHYESKTRGRPKGHFYYQWKREFEWMKKRWGHILENDPAYNPNLSLIYEDFSIGCDRNLMIRVRNLPY